MYRTRMKKIVRDVMSRKGRTTLVALSITIGVFGVSALVGMGDLLVSQLNADLDKEAFAMTHVYVVAPGGEYDQERNQEYIDKLAALPGVENVEGQAFYPIDWRPVDSDKFEQGSIIAFHEDYQDVQLEPISRIVDGRLPEDGKNEIAVEQRFVDEHGVAIGDKVAFRGSENEEWEVVGIVFQPYATISPHITDVTSPATPPESNIYVTYKDGQHIVGFPGLSSFSARYATVDEARAQLDTFLGTISDETPYIPVLNFIEDPDANLLVEGTEQITGVLGLLAFVAMLSSTILVITVIYTVVVEQRQQIGVMKSLGASTLDNFLVYTGLAFVYGLIGTIIGVMLAVPAASSMAQAIAPLSGTYIDGFKISTQGVIIGVVLGLVFPVLAAIIPVWVGTRISIIKAMTDLGISSKWGSTHFSRMIGKLPVPISIRQALSNVFQKLWRLTLTGLTLTVAIAAFMGVTALFSSLDETIANIFDTFDNEIQMSTQEAVNYDSTRQLIMDNIPEVREIVPGYSVTLGLKDYEAPESSFSAGSDQVQAFGIDPENKMINFRLDSGTGWDDDPHRRGVILNRTVAENIGKTAGDTVTLTLGGQSYDYEVIGVDAWPFDTIFFEWSELATIAGYTDENGNPVPSTFIIDLEGEPNADETADVIEKLKVLAAENGIQAVYANQPQNEEDISQLVASFGMIFNLSSLVMALVGAIGLLTVLSMAVLERQKEIGVMRSLGAGSGTIITQFLVEGILVGVGAWIAGLPLSYLLGNALNAALQLDEFFKFEYPPLIAVQGLIGVIVLAAIASIWPSVNAARKTVSDILRYQ